MTNFLQRGGLWVLSQGLLLLAVVLLAVRFRSEACYPVAVIFGGILLSNFRFSSFMGGATMAQQLARSEKPAADCFSRLIPRENPDKIKNT
jgi:hypothetical protein